MTLILIAIAVLVVMLLVGVPIPYAFFTSTLLLVALSGSAGEASSLMRYGYTKASSIILCAIPMFILAGSLMERGGIGESLVNLVSMFVGRIKGGLGTVMVVSCGLFGAISGSGMATLSCIGSIMLPRMYAAGYPRGVSSALISSASLLGLLIPPSLNMILFAFVGGQSVLACFLATVVPGIILICLLSLTNMFLLRKYKDIKLEEKMTLPVYAVELKKRTARAVPALVAPIIILGGIYGGIMTPTEAAAVSVLYSIPVGLFIYKGLRGKAFKESLVYSGTTAGAIMIMLFSVMVLSSLYVRANVPNMLLGWMTSITDNPTILLIFVNIFLIIIGMIMDDTSAILLTTPIMMPIILALGVDPVQFAAIMGVNLGLGCVTPPCAPFLYLGSRVGRAPVTEMLGPTGWFIALAWVPTLIVTTYIPDLALWLPRLAGLA
ncbi:MAG: TRAP transporter large permease [Clostridiales Family XIII bacterium]|jgi:tripartite ATP-independent transporter DctM subunit|nr:TRAP transporter large permease [Clostridiales Family XIII bacterium]